MTMLHFDTCHYGDDGDDGKDVGWNTGGSLTPTATGGPFNGRYYHTASLTRTLGVNATTLKAGTWWRAAATFTWNVMRFLDTGSVQCTLAMETATNKLKVLNGSAGTQLGIAAAALSLNTWYFVEWEVVFGNSGSTKVWVDGIEVVNVTSVDTTTTANAYGNQWSLPANGASAHTGECYCLDTNGSLNNDRLGPVKGYLLSPTGDGTHTAWAANTGTRWQAVDEAPNPDNDTTYISDNTPGNKNSVTLTNTAAGLGTIHAVADYARARRDDAGPHTFRSGLRVDGTDYPNATETLGTGYVGYNYLHEVSPDTSAAWTSAEIDAMEHYVETVS